MPNSLPTRRPKATNHHQPTTPVILILIGVFVLGTYFMVHAKNAKPASSFSTLPTVTLPGGSTTSTQPPKNKVTVQVANGTSVQGLASSVTHNLLTYGWNMLTPTNAPRVAATVIYYNPGYIWAASEIATTINVSTSAVQPLNSLQPVAGASGDDVIVILGPDAAVK